MSPIARVRVSATGLIIFMSTYKRDQSASANTGDSIGSFIKRTVDADVLVHGTTSQPSYCSV